MFPLRILLGAAALLVALPLTAQPRSSSTPRTFRSEVILQGYVFGNYFQAPDDADAESVNAYSLEYRAAWRPWVTPTDIYGHLDYINYTTLDGESTISGRLGVAHAGPKHEYNVFLDRASDRPSFELEETVAADTTMFNADYAYRITDDWQLGAEAMLESQTFDGGDNGQENDYSAVGISVRYRGFSRVFSPSIGYVTGGREFNDDSGSYDDEYWWVRVASSPHPRVYATLRYRDRTREYQNVARTDDRHQWTANVSFRQTERISWSAYYARESVDTTRVNRDFTRDVLLLSLGFSF
jgi:hypothetical protein